MEGKDVKRRFVQSTLFPGVESSTKEASTKKRRGSMTKDNSKAKKRPRVSSKKVIGNDKEISSKQVDDSDSLAPVNSSSFMKASQKRQQKRQHNQVEFMDSPDENDETCSPPSSVPNGRSTPRKLKQDNSTPRKGRRNSTPNKKLKSGRRELFSGQIPSDLAVDEKPLQTIPNLRLEAKLTAEENSRLFAGRQIHPFFMSCKEARPKSKLSSFDRKDKGIICNPIHVFENVEDDHMTLDWGHWIFSERSTIGDQECGCSPVYEGSVDSLNFDNFMSVSRFTRTSLYQNYHQCSVTQKGVSEELPDKPGCSRPISSLSLADNGAICSEQQRHPDMPKDTEDILAASLLLDHKIEESDLFAGVSCCGSSDSEFQDKLLQERIISHYPTSHNQPESCLWTDKYQPQNAKQICGNGEPVRFLSEWLHRWHRRGSRTSRSCMDEDNSNVQDTDHDYQQNDSDYDTVNDKDSLKNVLLITGPVGSGKSAAVYACARDQGFCVNEINTSDWRNGAVVKKTVGGAAEYHLLQCTVNNGASSDHKSLSKILKDVNAETHCSDNEVIELLHLSDKEDSQEACAGVEVSVSGENKTANCQSEIKNMILFEDVDATLCQDHGFLTTIQQLAKTAKRPMILTSNSENPVLPKNLDRLELKFSVPQVEELLGLVHMICASEKAEIHPCLVERFVNYCQGDIRKTIMLLQFWCQGLTLGRGNEFKSTHCPVLFDLDAGHHILPKVIHCDYASKLSELVEEEVVKSLILMEETHGLMGTNKSEDPNDNNAENIRVPDAEPDPVEVKKKAMLNWHCSLLDEVECVQFEANHELFDFSGSPVAFAREKGRRKNYAVLSSDSEDEFSGGNIPVVSPGVDVNSEVGDMKNVPISQCLSLDIHRHPTGPIYHSEVDKLEDHCQPQESVDYSHTEETCKSYDVSLVPESSYVPETEIIDETSLYSTTVSYGHFVNAIGGGFIVEEQDSTQILESALGLQSGKSLHILYQNDQETLGNISDTSTACVYQEEVGDSLSKSEVYVPRGYLDECSRVDLNGGLQSSDKPESNQTIDFVKETWKKLHDCNDLRKYVTAEEKTACQVMTFSHGMSNLISEADLLLKDCQTLVLDSLESTMIPSDKIHPNSYYDNQLEMSSILAQHGMCFFAKEIASLGSTNTLDLASEMLLLSSASSVALGKLTSWDQRKVERSDARTTKDFNLLTRKSDSCLLRNILQTVVPSRSYLAAKGHSFHEYISTLSQISRFEASRLSGCIDNRKQRRRRAPRHYLTSGSFAMSPEEISLLSRYNSLPKCSSSSS